jgi:hypothetical protein
MTACERCDAETATSALRCPEHLVQCLVDEERLCTEHAYVDPVTASPVCETHRSTCQVCKQGVAHGSITDGVCDTCAELSDDGVPAEIADVVPRTLDAGRTAVAFNSMYVIAREARLLRGDRIIVISRETEETVKEYRMSLMRRLMGLFR